MDQFLKRASKPARRVATENNDNADARQPVANYPCKVLLINGLVKSRRAAREEADEDGHLLCGPPSQRIGEN